ncbi:phage minor structural protein, partial [Ancylostoma caninum]
MSGDMQVETKKKEALLFWMNTYGESLKLDQVESLQQLWRYHVPSLLNCLKTDNNKRVVAQTAVETYQELLSYLLTSNGQEKFTASLSADIAAAGNELEIAKLDAFDEEQNEWWSVMVIRSPSTSPADRTLQFVTPRRPTYQAEEFTGMSVNRSSFITPRCPSRRSEPNAHTVARCDGSPLMEALNSPKVREIRRDREIRSLRKQVNELEDQLAMADKQSTDSRRQIESLVQEVLNKKSRIRELESERKILQQARDELEHNYSLLAKQLDMCQRQNESQKERLVTFKASAEKWEDARIELTEQLKAKEDTLIGLEREMRDVKDELYRTVQASRNFETERNNLTRLLDELKKAAESEREQYQAAISDCRKRYDDEISKNMALYSEEMEKNAVLQRETRDKSEIIEELQRKYEDDKDALQRSFDDLKKSSQEKCEILTKRLTETQAELRNLQERNRNMKQEHGEALRQLESVHLAETEQQNAQLSAARAHILELEEELAKREQAILDHRKEYARLTAEKDALEVTHKKAVAEIKMKDNELDEARRLSEKSSAEMQSLKMKHLEVIRSFECLQAETTKLENSMQEKEAELIELHKSVEELKTLKEVYSETSEALKNTREEHESQKKLFEQVEQGMLETIEDLKLKMCSAEQAKADAHDMIECLKQEWSSKERELLDHNVRSKEENEQLISRISELEENLVTEHTAKTELEGEVSECRAELASKLSELKELSQSLDTAQSSSRELSESISALKEELEAAQTEE